MKTKRREPLKKSEIQIVKMRLRIAVYVLHVHGWPPQAIADKLKVRRDHIEKWISMKCPLDV